VFSAVISVLKLSTYGKTTANRQIFAKYPPFPPPKHPAIAVFMDILLCVV
jgi:hypothetical protein